MRLSMRILTQTRAADTAPSAEWGVRHPSSSAIFGTQDMPRSA